VARKAADFDQLGMQVTPENVLVVYKAIAQEATRLNMSLQMFKQNHPDGMPPLGGDPVSRDAARGFTDATNQLMNSCQADVDDLKRVADGLHVAARSYGNSEEQITAAFNPKSFRYVPAPVPPSTGQLPSGLGRLVGSDPDPAPPAGSLRDLLGGR
jgi:uncharacterized protein YukE